MARSEWITQGDVRAEKGIWEHEGREYVSGGAFVSPTHAIGYPHWEGCSDWSGLKGQMRAWDGTILGTCRVVKSWRIRSHWAERMHQIEATIDGVTYTGRGMGDGMLWRGKVKRGGQ